VTLEAVPILQLDNVGKSYGPIRALDGVSLSVSAGEFVGLLGPNGAGKSTMFQIIAGLFAPDQGRVLLTGQSYRSSASAILRNLGVVFQSRSVDLEISIRANLVFHARLFGLGGKHLAARIDELARQFDLTDLLTRPVRQLSGGQQRKVEIARALINRPSLLIMDEPSAGLDTTSRRGLVADMLRLSREHGVAILWATHLVDEVENADRIIFLQKGKVLIDSTPSGVCEFAGATDVAGAYTNLAGIDLDPEDAADGP